MFNRFKQGKNGQITDPSEEIQAENLPTPPNSINTQEQITPKTVKELIDFFLSINPQNIDHNQLVEFTKGTPKEDIVSAINQYIQQKPREINSIYEQTMDCLDPESPEYSELATQKILEIKPYSSGTLHNYLMSNLVTNTHTQIQLAQEQNFEKSEKEQSAISSSMAKMGEVIKNIPFIKNLFDKQAKPDENTNLDNIEPNLDTSTKSESPDIPSSGLDSDDFSWGTSQQNQVSNESQEIGINLMRNREQGVQTLENMDPAQKQETFAKIKNWFENVDPRKVDWKALGEAASENKGLLIATGLAAGATVYVSAPVILSALGAMGLAGGLVKGTYIAGTGAAAATFGSGSMGTFGSMGLAGAGGSAGTIAAGLSAFSGGVTAALGKTSIARLFQKPENYEKGQNQTKKSIEKLQKKIVEHTLGNTAGKKLDKEKLEKFIADSISNLYAYLVQSGQVFPGDDIPELFTIEGQEWRKNVYFYELHENDKNLKYLQEGSNTPNPVTPIIPISLPDQPNVNTVVPDPSTPQQAPDPLNIVNPDPTQSLNQQPDIPLTTEQIEAENITLFSNRIAKELEGLISNKSISDNNSLIQEEIKKAIEYLESNTDAIRFINDGVDKDGLKDTSNDTLIVNIAASELEKCRELGIKRSRDSEGQYKISTIDYGTLKAHQIAEKISRPQESEEEKRLKTIALEVENAVQLINSRSLRIRPDLDKEIYDVLVNNRGLFGDELYEEIEKEMPAGFDFDGIENDENKKNIFIQASKKILEKYSGTILKEEPTSLENNIDQEAEAKRVNYLKNEASSLLVVIADLKNQEIFEHIKASRSGIIDNFNYENLQGSNLFDEIATELPEGFKIGDVDRSKMEPWAITAMVESYKKTLQRLSGETSTPNIEEQEIASLEANVDIAEISRTEYLQDFSTKLLGIISSDYNSRDLSLNEVVFRSLGIKMNDFINDYNKKVGEGENIYSLIQDKFKKSFSINGIGDKKVRDNWLQSHSERVEVFSQAALEVLSELSGQPILVEKNQNIPESPANPSEKVEPANPEETKRLGFIKRESQKLSEIITQESRSVPRSEYGELVFDIFCANMDNIITSYNDQGIAGGGLLEEIGDESKYTALGLVRLTMPENRRAWKSTIGYGQLSDAVIKVLEKYKDLTIPSENDINTVPEVATYQAEESSEAEAPTIVSPEEVNPKQVSNLAVSEKTSESSETIIEPDLQSDAQRLLGLFATFNNQQLCNGLFDLRDQINAVKKANGSTSQDIIEEVINQLPPQIVEFYNKRNAIPGKRITPPLYDRTAPMIREILTRFASGNFSSEPKQVEQVEEISEDLEFEKELLPFEPQSYNHAVEKFLTSIFSDPKKKEEVTREIMEFTEQNWGYSKNPFLNGTNQNLADNAISFMLKDNNFVNSIKKKTDFKGFLNSLLRQVSYVSDGKIYRNYNFNTMLYMFLSKMDSSVSADIVNFCKTCPSEGYGSNDYQIEKYIQSLETTGKLSLFQKAFQDAIESV